MARRSHDHRLLLCRGIHPAVQAREIVAGLDALRCVIVTRCKDDVSALDVGALVIFLDDNDMYFS